MTVWEFLIRLSHSWIIRAVFVLIFLLVEEYALHRYGYALLIDGLIPFFSTYYLTIPAFVVFFLTGVYVFKRWGRAAGVVVDDYRDNMQHITYFVGINRFRAMPKAGALVALQGAGGINRYWSYNSRLNESGYPEKFRFAWFHNLSPAAVHFTFEKYNKSLAYIDKLYDAVSLAVLNSSLAGRIHANEAFKQYDAAMRDALTISDKPFASVEEVVKLMNDDLALEKTERGEKPDAKKPDGSQEQSDGSHAAMEPGGDLDA